MSLVGALELAPEELLLEELPLDELPPEDPLEELPPVLLEPLVLPLPELPLLPDPVVLPPLEEDPPLPEPPLDPVLDAPPEEVADEPLDPELEVEFPEDAAPAEGAVGALELDVESGAESLPPVPHAASGKQSNAATTAIDAGRLFIHFGPADKKSRDVRVHNTQTQCRTPATAR